MPQVEGPEDWWSACVEPLYNGKGDKNIRSNYRGTSLLNIPVKVYGRVVIKRVVWCTGQLTLEEQSSCRREAECVWNKCLL